MPIFLSLALIACGSQKSENADEASADSVSSVAAVTPKDSLAMVKEENELLKTLLPDLCSRRFPTEEEVKEGLSGNFCRCISHYQVLEAVKHVTGRNA